jgi:hypothetical protein
LRDAGGNVGKIVTIEEDGAFQIDYLLPGSYLLEVTGNDRAEGFYQLAKVCVVIGSHDAVLDDILLRVLKPGEEMEYPH